MAGMTHIRYGWELVGVHRGPKNAMDISADLTDRRTPVAVVCAGCEGDLDLSRNVEVLEIPFGVAGGGVTRRKSFQRFIQEKVACSLPHAWMPPEEANGIESSGDRENEGLKEETRTRHPLANSPRPGESALSAAKSMHSSPRRCECRDGGVREKT